MTTFLSSSVIYSFRAKSATGGLFHLFTKPQDTVHIVAVLNTHLINLYKQIFDSYKTNVAWILIIVFTRTPDRRVIKEICRLSTQSTQRAFKTRKTCLQRAKNRR